MAKQQASTEVQDVLAQIMDRLGDIENRLDSTRATRQRTATVRMKPDGPFQPGHPNYMPHGSDAHAIFLGLLEWETKEEAEENGYSVLIRSRKSNKLYSLADELSPFEHRADPEKAARQVLRGKISSLESGVPQPYPGAPARFLEGLEDLVDFARIGG